VSLQNSKKLKGATRSCASPRAIGVIRYKKQRKRKEGREMMTYVCIYMQRSGRKMDERKKENGDSKWDSETKE